VEVGGVIGRNVLVLAPHTDDAELGCGGTMVRLREEGACVTVAVVADVDGMPCLRTECTAALKCLGVDAPYFFGFKHRNLPRQDVLDRLLELKRIVDPDAVLLPSEADTHQDHGVVYAEGLRAFKDRTVWGYELPWNHLTFATQGFVRLTAEHLAAKWAALCQYGSQRDRPYFDWAFIRGLARVRGVQITTDYAEAFEVVRHRW